MTSDTSGLKWLGSFAKLGPDGSWLRMYQDSAQLTLDGSLEPFSGTWPEWGIVSDGVATALERSEPPTYASGSSWWPTPAAQDAKNSTLPPSQVTRDTVPGQLLREGETGEINPGWYEALMGFPIGWTDLSPLHGQATDSTRGNRREPPVESEIA